MADGRSSASVVAVDPAKAAKERDAQAHALLREGAQSQGAAGQQFVKKEVAHTVPYTIKVVIGNDGDLEKAKQDTESVLASAFQLTDTVLNNYNPKSEVSVINALPVGQLHQMSAPLKRVIGCCQRVFNSSRGSFDPAVGPLVRALREAIVSGKPLSLEAKDALIAKCTLNNSFSIDLGKGTIARKHELAALDLGAVNKGYTVDYVVEKLNGMGYENVFFEWGGDVRGSGVNPAGQLWAVGIARPPALKDLVASDKAAASGENTSFIRVVQLRDEAIATSGDYENLVEGNGKLYTSIFDWDTKELLVPSATNLAQTTVKSYSCMYADALATATLLKKNPSQVRRMLDSWRYVRDTVTDYTTYSRDDERVARMYEIATENSEMRNKRISSSLPARVIVIGGGLAGSSAAIEAANCGAQVILLEKESKLGGNSAKATSGINGWGTRAQAKNGVMDGGKYFERDTAKSGMGGNCDPGLVKTLSVKSAAAIRFLTDLGLPLTVLSQLGGHSHKRTHRAPDKKDGTPLPIGFTIMRALEDHIRKNLANKITIMTNITVNKLEVKSTPRPDGIVIKRVTGVHFTQPNGDPMKLNADAVILATGGFSNDRTQRSLLSEYAPQLSGFPTTNGTWATGDGVKMARELGATLVDMDKVQLHPTGLIDPKDPANGTKFLGPEALRGSGGILLNKNGERFINELELRSVVSQAILAQNNEYPESNGARFAYCVLNEAAANLFGKNSLGFYWKKQGLFTRVENEADLAKLIGCDPQVLHRTLKQYETTSSANLHACPVTGKNVFPCVLGPQGPFYVAYVTPSIHYTMGGCLISPSAEIQTSDTSATNPIGYRRPILGLFGAGEVTGGVHGRNRLGGNSLLECVVFGRIAGDRAANLALHGTSPSRAADGSGAFGEAFPQGKPNGKWVDAMVEALVPEDGADGDVATHGGQLSLTLPSAAQVSGLTLGQTLGVRASPDGVGHTAFLHPSTAPATLGRVGLYVPPSSVGSAATPAAAAWLRALQPGDVVQVTPGPLEAGTGLSARLLSGATDHLVILASAPQGVGAALQLLQAVTDAAPYRPHLKQVTLVYAARNTAELSYRQVLQTCAAADRTGYLQCKFILEDPPGRWTDGVGVIGAKTVVEVLPPAGSEASKRTTVVQAGSVAATRSANIALVANDFVEGENLFSLLD